MSCDANALQWVCHDADVLLGVCRDANVPLVGMLMMRMSPWCMPWYECSLGSMLMMRMPPCRCVMMQRPPCGYQDVNVPLWVWSDANVRLESMPWCECPLLGVQWCKHNLFKNSFYFHNEASSAPEIKIFSKLDLLFLKSHLLFDLRLSKKLVITVINLWMGHWLRIWWSSSKDLFSQFGWAKGWLISMALFLKIKHLKKIHSFFLEKGLGNVPPLFVQPNCENKSFELDHQIPNQCLIRRFLTVITNFLGSLK